MNRDLLHLSHIIECISRVEHDTRDGREAFLANRTQQDAVRRNLQIFSESTQRLSPEHKASHPEIDWRNIAGFRNRLVHDYFNINLDLVWEVVVKHLMPLRTAAEQIAAKLQPDPAGPAGNAGPGGDRP